MCMYMHACAVYVCASLCLLFLDIECIHIYIYTYIHTYIHIYIYILTHIRTLHSPTCMHMYSLTYIYLHSLAHIHTHSHTHTLTRIHTQSLAHTHTHKPSRIYIRTHRAILHAEEVSERAVALTRHVIGLNSGNYTAWCYLRRLVEVRGVVCVCERIYIN
jgi:hypothetical protein